MRNESRESVSPHGTRAKKETAALAPDGREMLEAVTEWAQDNPHLALASAAAVGFLLGGGLTPRMLGAAGMLAARHYLKQTANELLEAVVPPDLAGEVMGAAKKR
jgi:dienelactone hydrolase